MSLYLLMALFGGAWLAGHFGWRRLRLAGIVAGLAFLVVAGCGALPKLLLRAWQSPYAQRPALDWAPSNAIVLLTAGATYPPGGPLEPGHTAFSRIAETVALYRDCRQSGARCTVLVSGGDAEKTGESLSDTYQRTLMKLGVPAQDQVLERRSLDTWGNASYARAKLRRIGADRVWLVTSAHHMRRAVFSFEHFGIAVTPVRADYLKGVWSLAPSTYNLYVTNIALHEYVGMALYHWYAWRGRGGVAIKNSRPAED
ncbi:YdcF family protein [Frateuria hangzhouensis]|uniref:YdcF family protein n=1 Tax=Frateuria hangzhouensis TaxID=2995589 RepID=UPI002260CDAA|nr:YdcF family protein [Frateuria sp. STR12]MCX7514198.1 YdcF family protein [Frateuria sp. STR12]